MRYNCYGGWWGDFKAAIGLGDPEPSANPVVAGDLYSTIGGSNEVLRPVFTDPNLTVAQQLDEMTVTTYDPTQEVLIHSAAENELVDSRISYVFTTPPTATQVAATPIPQDTEKNFLEESWDYWLGYTEDAISTIATGGLNKYTPPALVPKSVRDAAAATRQQQDTEKNMMIAVAATAIGVGIWWYLKRKKK